MFAFSRVDNWLSFQDCWLRFQFRVQHAAPQGAADLEATASVADPYENSCWWILDCLLVL